MKKLPTAVILASLLGLSACSGGGSDGQPFGACTDAIFDRMERSGPQDIEDGGRPDENGDFYLLFVYPDDRGLSATVYEFQWGASFAGCSTDSFRV